MHSLREETEDADKEALPVQPDRSRKASAEERLDTVPDLESNKESQGTPSPPSTPPPPTPARPTQLFMGGIVYCWRRTTEGALPACAEDGNSKLGLEGPFFRSVQ